MLPDCDKRSMLIDQLELFSPADDLAVASLPNHVLGHFEATECGCDAPLQLGDVNGVAGFVEKLARIVEGDARQLCEPAVATDLKSPGGALGYLSYSRLDIRAPHQLGGPYTGRRAALCVGLAFVAGGDYRLFKLMRPAIFIAEFLVLLVSKCRQCPPRNSVRLLLSDAA